MKHDTDRNVFVSNRGLSLTTERRMRALSFKDDPIFRHLCRGTGLRTNWVAAAAYERGRKGEERERGKIHGPRWHSKRVTFISNEQLFKGHATSYSHTWYARPS